MLSALLDNRRGLVVALCLSIAVHVVAIVAFAHIDRTPPPPGPHHVHQAIALRIIAAPPTMPTQPPTPVEASQQPFEIPPTASAPTEDNSHRPPVLVPPKLSWVKEIDLDTLEDHDGAGYVELQIVVGADGHATQVTPSDTNLPPMFTKLVVAAFLEARFDPGTLNGRPVPGIFRIRVNFR